jgi:heptosyltransferase II
MATPTLRALRSGLPNVEFVGVMRPVMVELLAGTAALDSHVLFEKNKRAGLPTRVGLVSALRAAKLDAIVLLTNSLWSAAAARLSGIPRIVGYNRDMRGWLLTERIRVPKVIGSSGKSVEPPTIDYYLGIAEHVGCSITDRRTELAVTAEESRLADDLWRSCQFDSARPCIVINNNAAIEQSRLWPTAKVQELARQLAAEGYQVLVHCGPQERERANQIAADVNHRFVASMGQSADLPIGLTKAVLARANAVVTTDSGPRHIAVALNRPVISLFGPTDPFKTRTYNLPETILTTGESFLIKHDNCMQNLAVQTVLQAVYKAIRHPLLRADAA